MNENLTPTTPIAPAVLRPTSWGYQWIVPCCPLCGGRHVHGGGSRGHDPHDLLGARGAHCRTGGARDYVLVEARTATPTKATPAKPVTRPTSPTKPPSPASPPRPPRPTRRS